MYNQQNAERMYMNALTSGDRIPSDFHTMPLPMNSLA